MKVGILLIPVFVLSLCPAFAWCSWTLHTYSEGRTTLLGDEAWYAKACPRGKVICNQGKPRMLHFSINENLKAHCLMGCGIFSILIAALGISELCDTRVMENRCEYWGACSLLGFGASTIYTLHDMWLLWRLKRKSHRISGTNDTYQIELKNNAQITGKRFVRMDIQKA